MDVKAAVSSDGVLTVTERIVFVTDRENRRGLIRNIPVVQKFGWFGWKKVVADFTLLSATLNGRDIHYVVTKDDKEQSLEEYLQKRESLYGRDVEIHLGDSSFLEKGREYEYVIRYSMTGQLLFHRETDELYWNVTGNEWQFPIGAASFSLSLPPGAAIRSQNAWTGCFGKKGKDWVLLPSGILETTNRLKQSEGFTVSTTWDKGLVAPRAYTNIKTQLDGMGRRAFAFYVLLTILGYAAIWYKWGRDPKRGIVIPLYYPPQNLEAGFIGYAKVLRYDENMLLADLIQLAIQGQICLTQGHESLEVIKNVREWRADISPVHRRLLDSMFQGDRTSVTLSGKKNKKNKKNDRVISTQKLVGKTNDFYHEMVCEAKNLSVNSL